MAAGTTGAAPAATRLACLPWYDLPETRAALDAFWAVVARHLTARGVSGVPDRLTRGTPVGRMLTDPALLLGQCCGYDVVYGFADNVVPVATPEYAAEGCHNGDYCSFVLVRRDSPVGTLAELAGARCVINGFNSHSGCNALRAAVAPVSHNGRFFSRVIVSGAHNASLAMLTAGAADVMAMDCVIHALLSHHRPEALAETRILCRTESAPAPPFVTATTTDAATQQALAAALADACGDAAAREPMAELLLRGLAFRPLTDYARIVELEGAALSRGYRELHATSPAREMP